jgi:2-methylisocitrate lyase-like PEP mutase family enzyme
LFIEAPRDVTDLQRIAARFAPHIPLFANMVDGGRTPLLSAAELADMGFPITLFPGATTRAVMQAIEGYFEALHKTGDIRSVSERLAGFDALNALLGLPGDVSREQALQERMERSWNDKTKEDQHQKGGQYEQT